MPIATQQFAHGCAGPDTGELFVTFCGEQGLPAPDCRSDFAAIVGPVQQPLALAWATKWIAGTAVLLDLCDVAADRLPAFDLPRVLVFFAIPGDEPLY